MVTVGDPSKDSTINSGTGLVSFLNAILSTKKDERFSLGDRSEGPRLRVSCPLDAGLCVSGSRITDPSYIIESQSRDALDKATSRSLARQRFHRQRIRQPSGR